MIAIIGIGISPGTALLVHFPKKHTSHKQHCLDGKKIKEVAPKFTSIKPVIAKRFIWRHKITIPWKKRKKS